MILCPSLDENSGSLVGMGTGWTGRGLIASVGLAPCAAEYLHLIVHK